MSLVYYKHVRNGEVIEESGSVSAIPTSVYSIPNYAITGCSPCAWNYDYGSGTCYTYDETCYDQWSQCSQTIDQAKAIALAQKPSYAHFDHWEYSWPGKAYSSVAPTSCLQSGSVRAHWKWQTFEAS
jgi:hypothetical protein